MQKQSSYCRFQYTLLGGQYKIGKIIDEGGFGAVLYAETLSGLPKAIKIVDLDCISQNAKRSVQDEQSTMRSIDSEYVMKCEQSMLDLSGRFRFIVMQLCSYFNLGSLIFFKGHFKELEAWVYLKNILAGLISMHFNHYSHRDIKPDNICIRNGKCVIIDLGCSKNFVNTCEGECFNNTVKKSATKIGTITNKSPQMLSSQKYSYRTDFWGVGILYYQMLTGVTPFHLTGDETNQAALKVIKDSINNIYKKDYIEKMIKKQYPPSETTMAKRANSIISPEAKQFLSSLIKINPNQRFNEVQLLDCLYLANEPQSREDNIWDFASCLLPLENIDWKNFTSNIRQSNIRQQQSINQTTGIAQEERKVSVEQEKLLETTLDKNFKEFISQDIRKFDQLQIYHFEIKRMKAMMQVHRELKSRLQKDNQLSLVPVLAGIREFCMNRLAFVSGAANFGGLNMGTFSASAGTKFKLKLLWDYLIQASTPNEKQYSERVEQDKKQWISKANKVALSELGQTNARLSQDAECYLNYANEIINFRLKCKQGYHEWLSWSTLGKIYDYQKRLRDTGSSEYCEQADWSI